MKRLLFVAAVVLGLVGSARADFLVRNPDEMQDHIYGRYALFMRQQGLTAETAKNAVWALRNNNSGPCAYWVKQLVNNHDDVHGGFRRDLSDLVVSIEQSHVCSREHLKDKIEKPKKPAYDPAKDSQKMTQVYFRNHRDDGIAVLRKAGVTQEAAERVAKLVAEDGTYTNCNFRVGMILYAMKTGNTGEIEACEVVDSINKGITCKNMEDNQP